jgi:hypothetical protein
MMAGIAMGRDESETMKRIETAKHLADRQRMESLAGNNPDYILENMKTPADMKRLFPNSIPADFAYIKGLAIGQKNFFKQQEDAALSSFYTDISEKMEKGMPIEQMRNLIKNQPGLTIQERETAMKVATSSYNTWQPGGTKEDPWKTTQDHNALLEMQIRISEGKPTTEMDIIRAQLAQPEKGPLFSNSDRNQLFTQLPDNDQKPELKTPSAKLTHEYIESLYSTEEYKTKVGGKIVKKKRIPFEKLGEYQSKLDEVNALLTAYKDNPVRAQKEIEASLVGLREENVKEWFEKWYITSPLTTALRIHKGFRGTEKTEQESPYEEYPDAYFINGEWRVVRDGVEYRIE